VEELLVALCDLATLEGNEMNIVLRFGFIGLLLGLAPVVPAQAQDGIGMRQIFGAIGLLPRVDREPIEYRDRPTLVVPKDLNALRNPEQSDTHTQNPAWPVDPDVEERKRELARRNVAAPELLSRNQRPLDGARLSIDDLRSGRAQRGAVMGKPSIPGNDKSGVRLSPDEWAAQQRQAQGPSYAPGTEPPRVYLTDPPRGLRQPAAGAPVRRTNDGQAPEFDNFRPTDVWRRLD
jgi:hypothetical protein